MYVFFSWREAKKGQGMNPKSWYQGGSSDVFYRFTESAIR